MNEWYEQAKSKLEAEKKAGSYDRYASAMKGAASPAFSHSGGRRSGWVPPCGCSPGSATHHPSKRACRRLRMPQTSRTGGRKAKFKYTLSIEG